MQYKLFIRSHHFRFMFQHRKYIPYYRFRVPISCNMNLNHTRILSMFKITNSNECIKKCIDYSYTDKKRNSNHANTDGIVDLNTYENVCEETLQSLTEYFDELLSSENAPFDADVSYGDGILTVKMGDGKGIYVINKQTPNRQIWLSSPVSGPKRYDFINSKWIYKHDKKTLHTLLSEEISTLLKTKADFSRCSYS